MTQMDPSDQMQRDLTDHIKRHDHTTTQHYGATPALLTANEARELSEYAAVWKSELASIALQITEAATNGLTKIVLPAYPTDPVREKLRAAGYAMHSSPMGVYIDWSSHVHLAPGAVRWRSTSPFPIDYSETQADDPDTSFDFSK